MNAAKVVWAQVAKVVAAQLPEGISPAYWQGFERRNRKALIGLVERALAKAGDGRGATSPQGSDPPDLWKPNARTEANLAAMKLLATKASGPFTDAERAVLRGYSGWGGLSLKKVADRFPAGLPAPDKKGLIHEYYTPTAITTAVAKSLAPHLAQLAAQRGTLAALEPSAGIGRFIAAFESTPGIPPLNWSAVEMSAVSAKLVQAIWPRVKVENLPFEQWITANLGMDGAPLTRFDFIAANPPYGPRGALISQDPQIKVKQAYLYFLLRGLQQLRSGGIGVFLIPSGFMDGVRSAKWREQVLKRHHLMAAFRLPSEGTRKDPIFPGANLVTDLLFFRARGGELAELPLEDAFIVEGGYFKANLRHILGEERTRQQGKGPKARRRYAVIGDFAGLPPWSERPVAQGDFVKPGARAVKSRGGITRDIRQVKDLPPAEARAVSLGLRVDRFLALITRGETGPAKDAWSELHRDLSAWAAAHGDPHAHRGLATLARRHVTGAERFLAAFAQGGELTKALATEPVHVPVYKGEPTLLGQADWLFRQQGRLTVGQLLKAYGAFTGSQPTADAAIGALVKGGWCIDGSRGRLLVPASVYYTGDLWPKVDRAKDLIVTGNAHAPAQLAKLMAAIRPSVFEDIVTDLTPRDSWLPAEVVEAWVKDVLMAGTYIPPGFGIVRVEGLLRMEGVKYETLSGKKQVIQDQRLNENVVWFLGWANHHLALFRPPQPQEVGPDGQMRRTPLDEVRLAVAKQWKGAFRVYLKRHPELQAQVEEAYNRSLRGYVPPTHSAEPVSVARWAENAPNLYAYQARGARRVLVNRRGLLAFDVGLGKSYTGCAILARARQEGWARRPVVVVPNSIVWKWKRDFERVLPDFNVLVIGSKRRIMSRGLKKGQIVADVDTPTERAKKWTQFQAGLADVVLLTYSALGRTRIDADMLAEYVDSVTAIKRQIQIGRAKAKGKTAKEQTERQEATLEEATEAWIAQRLEPPKGWAFDPGIEWHSLGIDFLMVDESQNFKNLFMPEEREGGIPDAMGGSQESKRAWQLDFRCASVRKHTGGSGVVLLSATPAKNGPVEFYNAIHLVDPAAWARIGIGDPEAFIDRFCAFESRTAQTPSGKLTVRQACVAFKNLHELRDVVFRYADFKTAEDVGLRIPDARNVQHVVRLGDGQVAAIGKAWGEVRKLKDDLKTLHGEGAARMREILRLKIMGVAAKVDLIAIHAQLPGTSKLSAKVLRGMNPHSAKIDAVVKTIIQTSETACTLPGKGDEALCPGDEGFCLGCGHIVFVENIAAHTWIKMALVEAGIPSERIAILNAKAARDPETRQQIAEAFNGVGCPGEPEHIPPRFDVVIANGVAYEGVDLQRRTCAIHHVDLPWDPSTLQQRNGRGVRQGNTFNDVTIHYYLGKPSGDGRRLSLIDKKRGWMSSLVKGQARVTNNPAAAVDISVEDLLLDIVPAEERDRVLKERQAEQAKIEEARRGRTRTAANRILTQAQARFRRAEKMDNPAEAGRLRAEGDGHLDQLSKIDPDVWPWFDLAKEVRSRSLWIPTDGPPLIPGMWVQRGPSLLQVGETRLLQGGVPALGIRRAGRCEWRAYKAESVDNLGKFIQPEHLSGPPTAEVEGDVPQRLLSKISRLGWEHDLGWDMAPAAWQTQMWAAVGDDILTALARLRRGGNHRVPVVYNGLLQIIEPYDLGSSLETSTPLPPTEAGWRELLTLAPYANPKWTQLNAMTLSWWGRRMPQGLSQPTLKAAA